jgi:hypothetical protein
MRASRKLHACKCGTCTVARAYALQVAVACYANVFTNWHKTVFRPKQHSRISCKPHALLCLPPTEDSWEASQFFSACFCLHDFS